MLSRNKAAEKLGVDVTWLSRIRKKGIFKPATSRATESDYIEWECSDKDFEDLFILTMLHRFGVNDTELKIIADNPGVPIKNYLDAIVKSADKEIEDLKEIKLVATQMMWLGDSPINIRPLKRRAELISENMAETFEQFAIETQSKPSDQAAEIITRRKKVESDRRFWDTLASIKKFRKEAIQSSMDQLSKNGMDVIDLFRENYPDTWYQELEAFMGLLQNNGGRSQVYDNIFGMGTSEWLSDLIDYALNKEEDEKEE